MALELEIATFQEKLPELVKTNRGQFALIHGDTLAGFWPTEDDALDAGYQQFGLNPFLVKEVTDTEPVGYVSRSVAPCR